MEACLLRKLHGSVDLVRLVWEFVEYDVRLWKTISSSHRIYQVSPCMRLPFHAKDVEDGYLSPAWKHDAFCCWFCGACRCGRACKRCDCPDKSPLEDMTIQVRSLFTRKFGSTTGHWYNAYDGISGVLYEPFLSPQSNVSGVWQCSEVHWKRGNWFLQGFVKIDRTSSTVECQSKEGFSGGTR